jgi:hypothetical protein
MATLPPVALLPPEDGVPAPALPPELLGSGLLLLQP